MKKIKYLAIALSLTLLGSTLTACGSVSAKDDFKEYLNNNVITVFMPESNDIVKTYSAAVEKQDQKVLVKELSETLATKNNALLEKLKAFIPKTTEVQELHNIYIKAVEVRKEAYVLMLESLTTKLSDESAMTVALDKLGESDAKFTEFGTKVESMKKDFGLVSAKE